MTTRTIVQITDPHLLPDESAPLHGGPRPLRALHDAIADLTASGLRPEALLITGDIANGKDVACYDAVEQAVRPFAEATGATVIYTPGNHDDREGMRARLLPDHDGETLDQVHWLDGLRIISLDSVIPGSDAGRLLDAQLGWLDDELATAAPDGTLLTIHHPPVMSPVHLVDNFALQEPERLAEVVRGRDVGMILCGHAHHVSVGALGGVPVWCGAATAYYTDVLPRGRTQRGLAGGGMTRIDLRGGSMVATHVPLPRDGSALYELDEAGVEELLDRDREHLAAIGALR